MKYLHNERIFIQKGYNYFIGYLDDYDRVDLLRIRLPKMSGYAKGFDETKYMSFSIKEERMFKNTLKSGLKPTINSIKKLIASTQPRKVYKN